MKFTRTVTVTQVRRKIALAGSGFRCPRCGYQVEDNNKGEDQGGRNEVRVKRLKSKGDANP
jgi:tRNA(Ile2) C34 agmatinyltransferase TiaS